MGCRLGECRSDSYRVSVRDRSGPEVVDLSDFTSLEWSRVLDGVSEATVELPPSCCGKLADVRTWRHELAITRDGVEQWVGPVRIISTCSGGIKLLATDVLGWLERRVIHNDHDWNGVDVGSVQAAEELVIDGFAPADPDVLKHLVTFGTGVIGGREYLANSKYVIDALNDLAKGSLDYTTIGRRIILMESGYELGRLPLLTCDSFADNVCTTEDGDAAVTRAVVTGLGVTGTAGGVDPYYGLVERLVDNQNIGRQSTADGTAAGLLRNPPPLLVQPPDGSTMSPDAPICLEQLVPGVTALMSITCTCREASGNLRLSQLKVRVNESGEFIQPLFAPVGLDTSS